MAGGGAVYDILGYVHPFMTAAHDGMKFSTPWHKNDLLAIYDCASELGGGWWFTKCALVSYTTVTPTWFSIADATFYSIEKSRMLIKMQ